MTVHETLIDGARSIVLAVPHFHLDVGAPRLLIWLPCHPSLKDLACTCYVAEQLLEVDIFVPDLIDSRHQSDCAVEQVAGVRDVTSFEFLLGQWGDRLGIEKNDV